MANEILPFGIGAGANVISYTDYEALPARSGGFVSGVARSEQLNTVWRQSSFVASVLAQFIASRSGQDVLDDGDTTKLLANLELAIKTYANSNLPAASTTVAGIAKLSSETNSSSELLAATPKAIKTISDATLKTANNLSEIKTAGAAAVAATLENLGLSNSDGSVGRLVNIQKFTSSGTYTPTAGTKFIIVKVIGGGGGGGASLNTNSTQVSMGGGAGAGGTAISKLLISSITSTVSVIIGAAGLGGTVSAIATSGGGSGFGSYLSATGGGYGAAGLAATLGNSMLTFNGGGGDGSNGNIANSIGGSGSQGIVLQSGYVSGTGGSSSISAGGQPLSTIGSSSPGAPGRDGSGGSGAFSYTNSAVTNGGNGGSGVVYVWEYA